MSVVVTGNKESCFVILGAARRSSLSNEKRCHRMCVESVPPKKIEVVVPSRFFTCMCLKKLAADTKRCGPPTDGRTFTFIGHTQISVLVQHVGNNIFCRGM